MNEEPLAEVDAPTGSDLLRGFRAALGLSQAEFASLAGIDRTALGKAELGKEPRASGLARVAEVFGGELRLTIRLRRPPDELRRLFGEERLRALSEDPRLGRGYRASLAIEWTQSLRKSQRWQKLVFGENTAASMPDAAPRMSAAKVSSPASS